MFVMKKTFIDTCLPILCIDFLGFGLDYAHEFSIAGLHYAYNMQKRQNMHNLLICFYKRPDTNFINLWKAKFVMLEDIFECLTEILRGVWQKAQYMLVYFQIL